MRRYATHALIVLNMLLIGLLVWLWVDQNGRLRDTDWTPPVAIRPDFSMPSRPSPPAVQTDMFLVLATLERPLFSPSRRPPPPVVAATVAAEPPADPLGNVLIQGIYSGTETGGIIANVSGVTKRISINEKIGDWTLSSIEERNVKFVRNDETRLISLLRARTVQAPVATTLAPNGSAPQPVLNAAQTPTSIAQKMEDESRERLRRRNELRAKAGRPPIAP